LKKTAAFILTLLWGLLLIQPVFGSFTNSAIKPSCLAKKQDRESKQEKTCSKKAAVKTSCPGKKKIVSSCAMSKCKKPLNENDKKECEETGCNPLMSCPAGNFFVNSHSSFSIQSLFIAKPKTRLVNDNRLSQQLSECFHPPELI
jgi:hypothetical protein